MPSERAPPRIATSQANEPKDDDLVRVHTPGQRTSKNKPFAIKICCGHAGLTTALWDAGLEAVEID